MYCFLYRSLWPFNTKCSIILQDILKETLGNDLRQKASDPNPSLNRQNGLNLMNESRDFAMEAHRFIGSRNLRQLGTYGGLHLYSFLILQIHLKYSSKDYFQIDTFTTKLTLHTNLYKKIHIREFLLFLMHYAAPQ